jgi:hypothetical protein
MAESPLQPPADPSAAQRLERLKVIVKHLGDTWPHLLQRQACLQSLGRREDLHAALADSYVAHITNMLQDVLVIDLLREIGALVLDSDSRSASVARAMTTLRDPGVIAELRAEYKIVRPLAHIGVDKLTPETRAEMDAWWEDRELPDQLAKFDQWRAELAAIDVELTGSEVGKRLWQARSKGVAHYNVVRSGADWKLWRVDGTGLTWGQINTHVDTCTKAIDTLSLLVLQTSFDFEESALIAQKYVGAFIEALAIGLRSQKQERDAKRERELE